MNFHVGQKVECIIHWPTPLRRADANYAEKGHVYTVRGHVPGTDGVERNEIVNAPMVARVGTMEFGFRASAFRPIVENKSSVSFTIGADPESERWDGRRKKAREAHH